MSKEAERGTIPKRPLGKTGYQVTIYSLGGLFTVARHDRYDEAVAIVNRAIDLGINYIDTSALYGNGASELNIGVTGYSARVLADALEDYPYDCALITLNAAREVMDDPEDLDRFFRLAQEEELVKIIGDEWHQAVVTHGYDT